MDNVEGFVMLESEGVQYKYPVEVLAETEDGLKVRWLGTGGFNLSDGYLIEQDEVILVPKEALFNANDEVTTGILN